MSATPVPPEIRNLVWATLVAHLQHLNYLATTLRRNGHEQPEKMKIVREYLKDILSDGPTAKPWEDLAGAALEIVNEISSGTHHLRLVEDLSGDENS